MIPWGIPSFCCMVHAQFYFGACLNGILFMKPCLSPLPLQQSELSHLMS
jgi:hypothetical protein